MPPANNGILVVDDNPILLNVISAILTKQGWMVRTASDGFSALAAIRDCVPDILLSDLNMDRMSGFELLSVVRRRFPRMAVIAMSGAYCGETIPRGVAADGFYAKGASSVARLIDLLIRFAPGQGRRLLRSATPIWVPPLLVHSLVGQMLLVSCPDCLRAFSHMVIECRGEEQNACCPHCAHPVQLALVREIGSTDQTLPYGSTRHKGFDTRCMISRSSVGSPMAPPQQR